MSTYTPQYQRPYPDGYVDRPDESTPEYARFINARDAALIRIEAFLAALQIPEKLSELVNDEGFIKNTVSNLANYYLKSETYARTETYTQAEVQALIADAVSKVSGKLNISVVDVLPTSDISTTTFYLVPKKKAQEKNLYDEYINTDGTESGWEFIGGVSTSIDLSDYYKKSEVDALLDGKMSKADIVPSKFEGTKAIIGNQASGGEIPEIDFSQSTVSSIHELLQRLANDIYPKTKPTLIPTMTSDTEPYGNASSNYTYSGRYAWYGFRHDIEPVLSDGKTFYYAGEPSATHYLQYEFKEISTVTEITLKAWGTLTENHLKVSYINENDEVIDVETLSFHEKYNAFSDVSYDFITPVKAKAIRITSENGNAGLAIAQLQAYSELAN